MAPKSLKKKDSNGTNAQSSRRVQGATPANQLEIAIGQQVRAFRKQLHMTVAEVASQAGLSPGMLSKIENGLTSPSLATLKASPPVVDWLIACPANLADVPDRHASSDSNAGQRHTQTRVSRCRKSEK